MAFPTTVDNLVDDVTVVHASQVLGPQRVTVGPAFYNVKSDQYGATGNGTTDDSAAIQSALNAASPGGIVYVPATSATYGVASQLTVPYGVELRLAGRSASTITALGTFPINTPVVRLGPVGSIGVGCRFRGGAVDCSNVTGSTGIYSEGIQENSGVYESMIRNYGAYGVRIQQGSSTLPQNFSLDDIEIFSGTGTGAGAIGLAISPNTGFAIPFREVSRITIFATGATQLTSAMLIDGTSSGIVRDVHIENAVNGILVGSLFGCFATQFQSITGNTNVTNTLVFSNANSQQNLVAIGVIGLGATHTIVDQIAGNTFTSEQAFYAIGNGGGSNCPVITTEIGVSSRLRNLTMNGPFHPGTPATGSQSGALYMGSGVPSNSNGNNGDYYFRTDTPGTANQRVYVKSAGSWTGIL